MSDTTVKHDVYAIITNRIIEQLEKGTVPWQKPWRDAGEQQNLISKKPYRGFNVLLLSSLGYTRNYFLTFKQILVLSTSEGLAKRSSLPACASLCSSPPRMITLPFVPVGNNAA
jgi:antirestriction protein ArdC